MRPNATDQSYAVRRPMLVVIRKGQFTECAIRMYAMY